MYRLVWGVQAPRNPRGRVPRPHLQILHVNQLRRLVQRRGDDVRAIGRQLHVLDGVLVHL